MNTVFFTDFLMLSDIRTLGLIALLFILFGVMNRLQKNRVNFSRRMLISTILGLLLGLLIQAIAYFPENPMEIKFIVETTKWYSLFGNGFMDLIRMLVVPLVLVSIIHVIINMKDGADLSRLTSNTLITTLVAVVGAVIVGIIVGIAFNVGSGVQVESGAFEMKEVSNIVDTLRAQIPANPVGVMVDLNIIGIVIFSAFFGVAAKRMSKKYSEIIKPFNDLINALHKIIMSVAMTIIKWMPYAVIALLANTIAQRGLSSILDVGVFIIALYISVAVIFLLQLLVLTFFGYNPITYLKKGFGVMVLAFTSRSSVGTLPMTIETLDKKMGVNEGTASFVASFGATAGMQGCAGAFPALLLVYIANINGIPIDMSYIAMMLVVITIGSLGIAGIPGTATMAASVALSGMGLAPLFPQVSPILAIDPIIDMGRTLVNVTGSMVNALIVDKWLGQIDMETFNRIEKNEKKS